MNPGSFPSHNPNLLSVIHGAETALGSNWSSGFVFLSVEANGDAAKAFNFEESKEYFKPSEEGKKLASEVREPRYKNIVHLWEFLLELLAEDNCRPLITWINKERGEFKLKNPEEVAKRWGILKRKKGMNYEKLGRALRYYYQQGIIKKVGPYSSFMLILFDNIKRNPLSLSLITDRLFRLLFLA